MINYAADEIHKFDVLAKNWWDPNGPMKPLHQLNPIRLQYVQQYSELYQKHIMDVGCGAGLLSESLAKAGGIVTAIDMSNEVLQVARQHAAEQNLSHVSYKKITIEEQAKETPAHADIVTCMELLEHVPDPASIIHSCADIVKPGGLIFFSTINRTIKAYLSAIIGAEYLLNLLPTGTHDYQQLIHPSELDRAARQAGLMLINLSGLSYHFLQDTFTLSTDISVNYICCYQKIL